MISVLISCTCYLFAQFCLIFDQLCILFYQLYMLLFRLVVCDIYSGDQLFLLCSLSISCSVRDQYSILPDLSNQTVRQSNLIEHQLFNCRTQSNIIKLTIKFCQSNTIERSISERLVIEPNRTFDYRTIGIIECSISERLVIEPNRQSITERLV